MSLTTNSADALSYFDKGPCFGQLAAGPLCLASSYTAVASGFAAPLAYFNGAHTINYSAHFSAWVIGVVDGAYRTEIHLYYDATATAWRVLIKVYYGVTLDTYDLDATAGAFCCPPLEAYTHASNGMTVTLS